jgi:hypothetical protein
LTDLGCIAPYEEEVAKLGCGASLPNFAFSALDRLEKKKVSRKKETFHFVMDHPELLNALRP